MPTHRMARTVLGLTAFKAGDWAKAEEHLKAAGTGPIGELTFALSTAWVKQAHNETDAAMELLDSPKLPEWAQYYMRYHKALIADIAGRRTDARAAYERVFKQDPRTLRTTLAYTLHAASSGDYKLARATIKEHLDRAAGEGHPLARALNAELQAGDPPKSMMIETPTQGMAEVFYGLGEALTNEGESGVAVGVLYLQLALYLDPKHTFALLALANANETTKRYDEAIQIYDRVPTGSPLDSTIAIRKALKVKA